MHSTTGDAGVEASQVIAGATRHRHISDRSAPADTPHQPRRHQQGGRSGA
jgi:hypothetical protein